MFNTKSWIIILITTIVIAATAIGGYVIYKQAESTTITEKIPEPSILPVSTPVDEIYSWEVYDNSKISFRYPISWNVQMEANIVTIFGPSQKLYSEQTYFPFYVVAAQHSNTERLDEKEWAKKNILTYCTGEVTKLPLNIDDFKVGEITGIKVVASDIPPTMVLKEGDNIWTFSINVGYCDGGSPVDENEAKTRSHIEIFNKILTTFKFNS